MPRSVLVLWADERSPNLGVRVLASGAKEIVSDVWPDASVTLQDFAPDGSGFTPVGREAVLGEMTKRSISRWISQYDLVLDTGAGDSFTDAYGFKRLALMTLVQRAARRTDTPYVLLPQTIGPFGSTIAQRIAKRTLSNAAAVFVRDRVSLEAARSIGSSDARLTTDLVFSLSPSSRTETSDVIVNVSGLLWSDSSHVDGAAYRRNVVDLIEKLLDSGRSVKLLAHVLENPSKDNDLVAISALQNQFDSLDVMIPESLREARSMIAGAKLLVGSRMHACLNAISQGVPAIPWAYSRKFEPLLNDIGWPHVVDLRRDANPVPQTIEIAKREDLDDHAHEVADRGSQRINELKEMLRVVFN